MAGKVQTAAGPSGQVRRLAENGDQVEQRIPKRRKKAKRFYGYNLLFCITFLTAFGLVAIYSVSSYSVQLSKAYDGSDTCFMQKQTGTAAVGLVAMLIISKIGYHILARFSVFAYLMSYILMVAVGLFGREVNDKKCWLGVGPLSLQPTEFVKIALIALLAAVTTTMGMKINK